MRWLISLFVMFSLWMQPAYSQEAEKREGRPDPIEVHGESNLGWHFYNEYADEVEVKEDETVPVNETKVSSSQQSTEDLPELFSTAWFSANYDRIEKAAIDNPTKENIRALLVTERMMLDKSEVFARTKVRIAASDPLLQDNMRIPLSGYGKSLMFKYKKKNIKLALEELSKKAGIFYFYDGKCIFCHQMLETLNYLREIHGWEIRVVAKNIQTNHIQDLNPEIPVIRDNFHSKNYQIKYWPTLMMVVPESDTPNYIITQGVMSMNKLVKTIITVALEQKELDDEWFYKVFPEERGLVSQSQLAKLPKDISDNPTKLINHAMEAIENPAGTMEYIIDLEDVNHEE
ncbi:MULTISPECIES: conjugal transfer protein TraF [Vibrio]|uniref:conjugal transfer protein TraF n=1 Tax=Vibrio TaxID=662 RepID=UPI00078D1A2A|nr:MULTISPECIES: conjugal transfer protein TraF [Vibrio]BAU70799.1 hypothetical protein [Vibrio sp. 04Ya108]BBM67633.1 hypothetical protein VA249_42790 [Vibrio alfacsensis]BCN27115.1 hypothetical protein VYA_43070 [Vibrio alfacsensis]